MKVLRQMGAGVIIGVISLLLVIGGISLSLAETAAPTSPPTPSPIPSTFAVEFASPFPSPTLFILPTSELPTSTSIPTFTPVQAVTCTIPGGWIAVTVGVNDTLYSIAERYKTTADILNTNNCLNNIAPAAGSIIYVPPVPTVTVIPCGPPSTWVKAHIVKPDENLYRISLLYRTTVPMLQTANCMGFSTIIHIGQVLWVPNVPTSTPGITITPTSTRTATFTTPTHTATRTPDFSTPTNTATRTPDFSTPTNTATSAPTQTLTPLPTQTSTQ